MMINVMIRGRADRRRYGARLSSALALSYVTITELVVRAITTSRKVLSSFWILFRCILSFTYMFLYVFLIGALSRQG